MRDRQASRRAPPADIRPLARRCSRASCHCRRTISIFSHVVQRDAKSALICIIRGVIVRQPLPDRQRPPVRFHGLGRMIGAEEHRADAVVTCGQLPLELQ